MGLRWWRDVLLRNQTKRYLDDCQALEVSRLNTTSAKAAFSALVIITSHFRPGRYLCTADVYREMIKCRFDAWEQVGGAKESA
jgi:hypothetical protein